MPRPRAPWPLENHHLHRWAASRRIAAPMVLDGPMAAGIRADYADVLPSAFTCFDDDFGACIAHLRLPVTHRRFDRTTNLLERLFVEERRRLKIIGEKPVLKLMFGALIRAAERWRGLRFTEFELPDRRRQKGTRPGIRGLDHAAGKVIPAPRFQQIRALTDARRRASILTNHFLRKSGGRAVKEKGLAKPVCIIRQPTRDVKRGRFATDALLGSYRNSHYTVAAWGVVLRVFTRTASS